MAKVSRPIVYSLVFGVVAYAAMLLTEPEPVRRKPLTRPVPTAARRANDSAFLAADYDASFPPLTEQTRDAFKPLVFRKPAPSVSLTTADPSGIPAGFADGDPNWTYRGMASVDGVGTALLENGNTGEGVFVKEGERWKRSTVLTIGSESLVLSGPDGITRRITVGEKQVNTPEVSPLSVTPPIAGAPLRGPIGAGSVEIVPAPRGTQP